MNSARLRVATLMLGLAVTFSGCSLFKSSSAPDDGVIVAQIQSKLYQDPVLKNRDIHVISQKGVVVLSGTVGSNEEKNAVEHFAQGANGVQQVIDQVTVSSTPTAASQAPEPAPPEHHGSVHRSRRAVAENEPPAEPPEDQAAASPAPAPVVQATPAPAPSAPPPPPPPQPVVVTIPAGTVITVRTIDNIDSSVNHPGEEFAATVESPVVEGGQVVIHHNAEARIRLINSRTAGSIKGQSEVEVALVSLRVGGRNYAVDSSVFQQQGASRGKRSAKVIGGGAGLGALIGAIAGGGRGAAIGAAIGAGGGTAVQASTKGQQVKIPSETKLDFTLRSPVTVTLPPQPSEQAPQN
jgi:BON domain